MLILVEGYLRKRCANLPVMRRRYCMLVVDDSRPPPSSSSTKIKVMLRSYKSEDMRHASIDSFVSSHVVKCIGEWTGKGNLHTYPNAFVVETLQSKLFHCSADTPEDKAKWTSAIAVFDRLSVGSSSVAPPIDTPTSFTHDSDAAEPIYSDTNSGISTDPPPAVEVQRPVETPDPASSFTRNASTRPKSLRNEALFKAKQGRRANYNDIDMDSDDDHDAARVDSLHLDGALLHQPSAPTPVDNDLDDIPFNHVEVPWSSMKMQYTVAPDTTPATSDRAVENHDDDEEEFLDLNPDMVARFSHMRMLEARGLAKESSIAAPPPPRTRRGDGTRKGKGGRKDPPSVVDEQPPTKPKKKKKKERKHEHAHQDGRPPERPRNESPPPPQERRREVGPLPPPPLPTTAPRPPPSLQLPAIDDF